MRSLALALAALALFASTAAAKARYLTPEELVAQAPLIALVDVSEVQPAKQRGRYWTYGQAATARIVSAVRGELPVEFTIHAEKDFLCARASYRPGRYLVFLRREGALYTTLNHHLGCYLVAKGRVSFPRLPPGEARPLAEVLAELRRPEGFFARSLEADGRRYTRQAVTPLEFPGRVERLGRALLVRADYTSPIPTAPGSNVRGVYNMRRYLLIDDEGVQQRLPEGAPSLDWLRQRFLGSAPRAKDAAQRRWVVNAFMHLAQGGEHSFGAWWGESATQEEQTPAGLVVQAQWSHGKSFSWTDVLRFRFKDGRLVGIDHHERQH